MATDKIIVIDTCALLPNCQQIDRNFDVEKWRRFLRENNEFELNITPFTLYEILTINNESTKNKLLEYLEHEKINVLSYRKFPGLSSNFVLKESNKYLNHLKKLIIYECNRLLEDLSLNYIFLNIPNIYSANILDAIVDDLNELSSLDAKAGDSSDLKIWLDKDYFECFFARVSQSLRKNANWEISSQELIRGCLADDGSLYGNYPLSNMTIEDRVLSRYILRMSLRKKTRHKLINYVIDALNLHSALQKNLDAFFVTKDEETIDLFKNLENESLGVKVEDKVNFLNQFLIFKSK